MTKEIIIQHSYDETRMAVFEEEKLVEYDVERGLNDRLAGSIFKGRVENVLPGMQAAFVDIGLDKNAFLYVDEALPLCGDKTTKPNITSFLKAGQEILVQVTKEPVGTKGPRVTCKLTLPGRYVVLMPESDDIGISRKISKESDRERIKAFAETVKSGTPHGLIIRTIAEDASMAELLADFTDLVANWNRIKKNSNQIKTPGLIHRDYTLIERVVRDFVTDDVDRIVVNTSDMYEPMHTLLRSDGLTNCKLKLLDDEIIEQTYNLQVEIEKALKRKVWLKNGGYLVIDETEALTSIDINTGKYVGTKDLQDTVVTMNTEAAVEIARQIRLRNLGGIIIIDFIDMLTLENRSRILETLEQELQRDKTKAHVLDITQLGLVEVTRKKVRMPLSGIMEKNCPYCDGKGRILSEDTTALKIKAELREIVKRTEAPTIVVTCHPLVAARLLGENGLDLLSLRRRLNKEILVHGKSELFQEDYTVQVVHAKSAEHVGRLPVEQHEIVRLTICDGHQERAEDGIARVDGFVINVIGAGQLIGQEVLVEIDKVYQTNAVGRILI